MEKTYKTESRHIKRLALNARVTFRWRKLLLDYQPLILIFLICIMNWWIVDNEINHNYYFLVWFALCVISIPMFLILNILFSFLTRYKTLEEQIEGTMKEYLKDHSWRHIYLLMKKHNFPEIVKIALGKILYQKVMKKTNNEELISIIEKDNRFKIDKEKRMFTKEKKEAK
ncbi:MAG: hypothetical protein CL760_01490 [Chloroflexi bacterium]|nr:hypothetical protein [Chloroflexota bacterium]|tara:strand:- start:75153 stop:75665 length:513 start_codon:yes stop_codon:yes gene_type:complete